MKKMEVKMLNLFATQYFEDKIFILYLACIEYMKICISLFEGI